VSPLAAQRRRASHGASDEELFEMLTARVAAGGTSPAPVIVAGAIGAGKTETGLRVAQRLKEHGITVGGILAPRLVEHGETTGYNVLDLATGEDTPFARPNPPGQMVGRFYVRPTGLAFATRALRHGAERAAVVFIDEVGRWELAGEGHAAALRSVLGSRAVPVLFVRAELVPAVVEAFHLHSAHVVRLVEALRRDSAKGRQSFWDIVDSVPYPLLVTVAADGFPQSRPMTLVARDEHTLWFPTSRTSRKIGQIAAHAEVTVLFVDSDRYNYASFHGVASIDDDRARACQVWRAEWRDDWPQGVDDPSYALLRVDGVRGFYSHGQTGDAGEIDLQREAASQ
jgi:nucleoside-triphosphatase THEP1